MQFEREEQSGQLFAYSETTIAKSYWIDEGAWFYLTIVQGDRAGQNISKPLTFDSLDEAKDAAEKLESNDE